MINTWARNLSSTDSRTLGLLAAYCAVFPADICMVEIPHQEEPVSATRLVAETKRLLLIRQPVEDPSHHMSFTDLVPDLKPLAFNLILSVSQRQLFIIYSLLNIEGNFFTSPAFPTPSKKLIILNHSIPVVQFYSLFFCDSN